MDETDQQEPSEGDEPRSPRDPRDPRSRGQTDPSEAGTGEARRPGVPAWDVVLPPEWRDAFDRGEFERIPPEYRELVERYMLWLRKEAERQESGEDR